MRPMPITAHSWKYLDTHERFLGSGTKVSRRSWKRQTYTAREILGRFRTGAFGQLLADDTGLGKTWVASIVALTFARSGRGRALILAPSRRMVAKWNRDLGKVRELLASVPGMGVDDIVIRNIQDHNIERNRGIAVITHDRFAKGSDGGYADLSGDLLIVDEAHRSKGEGTNFRTRLNERIGAFARVLFLTATPFSIGIDELISTMKLVSEDKDDASWKTLKAFSALCDRWSLATETEKRSGLKDALTTLQPWVIRHTVDGLRREREEFGELASEDAVMPSMTVPPATSEMRAILARADRLLNRKIRKSRKRAGGHSMPDGVRGSDPRFAVGWRHLRDVLMRKDVRRACKTDCVARLHYRWLRSRAVRQYRRKEHPKISAVASAIVRAVQEHDEKVVVFCTHKATRDELLKAIQERLDPPVESSGRHRSKAETTWKSAMSRLLRGNPRLIAWASRTCVRNQITSWIGPNGATLDSEKSIIHALKMTPVRPRVIPADEKHRKKLPTIDQALRDLCPRTCNDENQSDSGDEQKLTTWRSRAFTLESDKDENDSHRRLFNTPFGPDVLVATNKFSEGIDLHEACRILVHYELDPSPVRVKQREGRVRRIRGWAHKTGLPVVISTPYFPGTRDEQLVRVVRSRLLLFNRLLGGVREVKERDLDVTNHHDEKTFGSVDLGKTNALAVYPRSASSSGIPATRFVRRPAGAHTPRNKVKVTSTRSTGMWQKLTRRLPRWWRK